MTDMKCPFCQQELEEDYLDVKLFGCENQNCKHSTHYDTVGTKELWEALINERQHATDCQDLFIEATAQKLEIEADLECTRKALDVAKDALKHYCTDSDNWSCVIDFTGDYDNTPSEFADKALEQITALEQKDVK